MSVPAFSVKRPVASLMIIIAFIVLGAVSITRLPLALFPDFNFPAAVVMTTYENVGPREVEAQVTRPIEEAMATVSNVRQVSSTSAPGSSTVIVQFEWGTDMDFAALEMRERLDLILSYLPDGVERPQVFRFDPSMQPMFQFNVGGMEDLSALRQFVEDQIKNRLERVEGVARVNIVGGLEREIRVEVDQSRLEAYGLSVDHVMQALAAGNLTLPGGRVVEQGRELTIRTVGEFTDLEQIRQTVIGGGPGGVVRVQDVARVYDGHKEQQIIARLNGQPSVAVTVQREALANTVTVSNQIRRTLEALERELGDDLSIQIVWDEADFVRLAIRALIENAVTGAIIAMAVLYFFLRALGPTLIVGSAIPVAGMATFFFLYLMDISLNLLSLGGIALGVGMLVDNAIVSLENIVRHRQEGKDPQEAAIAGTEEVGLALGASTLTTVAVFVPIVFVGGIAGELFRDLSLAVAFALIMSLVAAVTFVPMVAARTKIALPSLTVEAAAPAGAGGKKGRPGLFGRLRRGYERYMRWILQKRIVAVVVVLALASTALILYPRIGQEFLPATDTGEIGVRIRLPYGSTMADTDAVVRQVEAFVAGLPDVRSVFASVGGQDGGSSEVAIMHVSMRPYDQRSVTTEYIVERIREFGATLPGVELSAAVQDPFGLGDAGGAPVVVRIKGEDPDELRDLADMVAEVVASVPGTRDVSSSMRQGRPELQVIVDRDRAASYGLSVYQIASALRTAVDGAVATLYRPGGTGTEINVTVQLAEEWRRDAAALERILVPTPMGVSVPLHEVASIVEGVAPVSIDREDQARVATVSAYIVGRDLSSVTGDIEKRMADVALPPGYEWEFAGETVEMEEAFDSLGFALALAVVLVYMIMAAQFESLVHPLIIMVTVPLGFMGVVWAMAARNMTMSVTALIGVIMLAGIVVNNGIVMIDYVNQLRRRGMERTDAVVTGASTRLRPVLMTTLTTVLGMVPMAFAGGEGAELQAPIATVVIGGLTVSTALTLGFLPVVYTYMDDFGQWVARAVGRARSRRRGQAAAGVEATGREPEPSGAAPTPAGE